MSQKISGRDLIVLNLGWDLQESLPQEYARIFAFDNFNRTQKHVLSRAREMEQNVDECIPAGSYARLHIREVPNGVANKLNLVTKTMPVILCGLMQHESKISVLHFRYLILLYDFVVSPPLFSSLVFLCVIVQVLK